jgi:hypothetical protein
MSNQLDSTKKIFEPNFLERLIANKDALFKHVKNELNQAISKVKDHLNKNDEYNIEKWK